MGFNQQDMVIYLFFEFTSTLWDTTDQQMMIC
jgi:hypothetical protein